MNAKKAKELGGKKINEFEEGAYVVSLQTGKVWEVNQWDIAANHRGVYVRKAEDWEIFRGGYDKAKSDMKEWLHLYADANHEVGS